MNTFLFVVCAMIGFYFFLAVPLVCAHYSGRVFGRGWKATMGCLFLSVIAMVAINLAINIVDSSLFSAEAANEAGGSWNLIRFRAEESLMRGIALGVFIWLFCLKRGWGDSEIRRRDSQRLFGWFFGLRRRLSSKPVVAEAVSVAPGELDRAHALDLLTKLLLEKGLSARE